MQAQRTLRTDSKAGASGAPFRRILVPTDLTERTVKALRLAAGLSNARHPQITLLHVIETVRGLDFESLKSFYRKLENKARTEMALLQRRAIPKANVQHVVVYGTRAEEIVRFASRRNVDLIVLPSHTVNPRVVGRDWGTISYKVGILASCPVLLVK
jgi:nucleotide-binding universal stress UspA family protein